MRGKIIEIGTIVSLFFAAWLFIDTAKVDASDFQQYKIGTELHITEVRLQMLKSERREAKRFKEDITEIQEQIKELQTYKATLEAEKVKKRD